MDEKEYQTLLDRAFSKLPELSVGKSDFVIPNVETMIVGNKTSIRNLLDIADKARKKPEELSKYLSKDLAVPTYVDDQMLVINGKFSNDMINKSVKRYFEVYVICGECHKPDTHLESAGRGITYIVCEACGARYAVKNY